LRAGLENALFSGLRLSGMPALLAGTQMLILKNPKFPPASLHKLF
jgi:hypothetical protein